MNIIVTGGSNGIGKQVALYLAKDKANKIIITGRDKESMMKTADASENRNISFIVSDFRKLYTTPDLFRKNVESVFKTLDVLINNAGNLYSGKFADTTEEHGREMMEVNFFAPVFVIKTLLPLMNRGAHIVNISSMGGYQGSVKFKGLSYYSASKAAIACISECLATEFSESGISVNCLALGSVQTVMFDNAFPGNKATVSAADMGRFIGDFALTGSGLFNGKIIPVAHTTP
jgi:NAD(P)-dependent dehydrogenase (short-subunit alcohol dehydrogenase family)